MARPVPEKMKGRMAWEFCESVACPYFMRITALGQNRDTLRMLGIPTHDDPESVYELSCASQCFAKKYHDWDAHRVRQVEIEEPKGVKKL
jgi:hypothetical protein